MRPTINKATSAKRKSSKKGLVYSKSMPTITCKLNYFLIKLFLRGYSHDSGMSFIPE